MRSFISLSLLNSFTLFLVGEIYPGLIAPDKLDTLLITGVVFALVNSLIKPVIKLLLLPLNLVTLGLLSWVNNVFVLFIMTRIAPELQVIEFTSSAVGAYGFAIPSLTVSLTVSYILASVALSLTFSLLNHFLLND